MRDDDSFILDTGIDRLIRIMNIGDKSVNMWQKIIRRDIFIDFVPYQEGGAKPAFWLEL
jgi:hypothetical protein